MLDRNRAISDDSPAPLPLYLAVPWAVHRRRYRACAETLLLGAAEADYLGFLSWLCEQGIDPRTIAGSTTRRQLYAATVAAIELALATNRRPPCHD